MSWDPGSLRHIRARFAQWRTPLIGMIVLALGGAMPAAAGAQQTEQPPKAAIPLVFDGVTVIDVETGKLLPNQRVVIKGNRIQAVGNLGAVARPQGAQIVPAKGKYLVPGFWDMHFHPGMVALAKPDPEVNVSADVFLSLFILHGVTGFRDAWSRVPLETLVQWHREILAGTRVGPPRQLLSGAAIDAGEYKGWTPYNLMDHITVTSGDSADMDQLVSALKNAGATWLKPYSLDKQTYFILANAARRHGMPFGGHAADVNPLDAADSGATSLDHTGAVNAGKLDAMCFDPGRATVEACRKVAEKFRKTNTWSIPTLSGGGIQQFKDASPKILTNLMIRAMNAFWTTFKYTPGWLAGHEPMPVPTNSTELQFSYLKIAAEVGLPVLVGGDTGWPDAGFETHADMAVLVDRGLTPLAALQAATINPARAIRVTDSLGTVAAGKLADLVLLDANPLADITNTTMIRAVVANGHYFDRAALDDLAAQVKAKVQ